MPRFSCASLPWVVGSFCAVMGALMLIAPHQFRSPAYAALGPHLSLWGTAFLLGGVALLTVIVLALPRLLAATSYLTVSTLLLLLAYGFSASGTWTGTVNYTVLGIGLTLAVRSLYRSGHAAALRGADLFAVLMGIGTVLTGALMLTSPDQFRAPVYDVVRPYLPWYGGMYVVTGLGLVAAQMHPAPPQALFRVAHLLTGGALLTYLVTVGLPYRIWTGVLYSGGFGLAIVLLPWLGPRLNRLDGASLRTRLALALAAASLPLVVTVALFTDWAEQRDTALALQRQEALAVLLAQDVADYLDSHRAVLVFLATQPDLVRWDADAQRSLLRTLGPVYPELVAFAALDAEGNVVSRSSDHALLPATGGPWAEAVRQGVPVWEVVMTPATGLPVFRAVMPVTDADGGTAGVVAVFASTRLAEHLDQARAGEDLVIALIDGQGRVFLHLDEPLTPESTDPSGISPVAALLAGNGTPTAGSYPARDGERLVGYAPVPGSGWDVVVERPEAVVLAGIRGVRELAFGALFLFLVVSVSAGVLAAGWLAAPLRTLVQAVNSLTAGDDTAPLPQSRVSEVTRLAAAFGQMRDRLAARTAEREQAEAAHGRLVAILEATPDLVGIATPNGQALYLNQAGRRMVGVGEQEPIEDRHISDFHPEWAAQLVVQQGIPAAMSKGTWHGETALRGSDGHEIPISQVIIAHAAPDGALQVLSTIARDISERKRAEDQVRVLNSALEQRVAERTAALQEAVEHLEAQVRERRRAEEALAYQARYDTLTGLPNRALLQERLQRAILSASRRRAVTALLLLDVDRFKDVNDTFGHAAGDALLQQVAHRLPEALRRSGTVARLGGDEFAVILPVVGDREDVIAVARRLSEVLKAPFAVDGGFPFDMQASIGIALYPDHGADAETLMRRADVAMYVAKQAGSGYAVYAAEQDQYHPERLALLFDLRRAIEQDDLLLHYQPQMDLATRRVAWVEALARWNHPQKGMIPPGQFVPLAEQTGLIRPLTEWALNAALRQVSVWQKAGLDLGVAVNLSARDLHNPQLLNQVTVLLDRWGVAPTRLKVEITESCLMEKPDLALEILSRFRTTGVQVAIDDFGTGYSSLAYLKGLPLDELKIDKSFVQNMTEDGNDTAIVRLVIALGHDLGLQVLAEGVEHRETLEALAALGCDVAQGYYLSRPVPADELVRWLDARTPVLEDELGVYRG